MAETVIPPQLHPQANNPPQVCPSGHVPVHPNGGTPPQVKSVDGVVDDVEVDVSELLVDDSVELVVVGSAVDELEELVLVEVGSSVVDEVDVELVVEVSRVDALDDVVLVLVEVSTPLVDVELELVVVDAAVDDVDDVAVVLVEDVVVETVTVRGQPAGAGASSAPKRPGSSYVTMPPNTAQ